MAVRRKGWDDLSVAYRRRLERGGITRAGYETGEKLGAARGHKTPAGVGERSYASLRKQANALPWRRGQTGTQMVIDLLAQGYDAKWIRARLKGRVTESEAYRGGAISPPEAFKKRDMIPDMVWYWYH